MVRLLIALVALIPLASFGEVFYDQPEQGWYWYDVNQEDSPSDDKKSSPQTIEAANQELNALRKDLEDKKALALMNPTEENLKQYIQIQNEATARAEVFATTWQKVVIQNPELDNTIANPVDATARRVYHEEKAVKRHDNISNFTSRYGLFFFFRSNCSYCHKFSPILKMFEQEYGITVVPISLDGQGLPEYPSPKSDNGISKKLNIDIVPAVIAVDPKTGEIVPLSYGLVSLDELSYRINLLAEDKKGIK